MVDSGWLVLFSDVSWMVAVISWRALDGCWMYTTFNVNVGSRAGLQRTQCQLTPRLASMLRIHTACSTQETLPAARV